MRRRESRGFTLLEVMISAGLLAVVLASGAVAVQLAAVHTRNGKLLADGQGEARFAVDSISSELQQAGVGGPLMVAQGGATRVISQVHGFSAPTQNPLCGRPLPGFVDAGPSDLFLVTAGGNATIEGVNSPALTGTRGWVTNTAPRPATSLDVDSVGGYAATGNTLILTDFQSSALLTNATATVTGPPAGTVASAELAITGFAVDPQGQKPIRQGIAVMPARVLHYYLCPNAGSTEMNLYRSSPTPCATGLADPAPAFCDEYNSSNGVTGIMVARNIVNFLVLYGVDTTGAGGPASLTWMADMPPSSANGPLVREVRVQAVSITDRDALMSDGRPATERRPRRAYRATVGIRNNMLNGFY